MAGKGRVLALGVGGVVLLVGVAIGATGYLDGRDAGESRAFARIENIAMAGLIPEAKDAPKFADGLPHFKTEAERQDAAAKEVEAFLSAHAASKLKNDALLLRARYQLLAGKAAEAVASYQSVIGTSLDERLHFVAKEGLGFAYEASGDKDKAVATFSALADSAKGPGNFYGDRALFDKARVLAARGSTADAAKILHEILDKSPTSSLRDEITDRLAVLEGK